MISQWVSAWEIILNGIVDFFIVVDPTTMMQRQQQKQLWSTMCKNNNNDAAQQEQQEWPCKGVQGAILDTALAYATSLHAW